MTATAPAPASVDGAVRWTTGRARVGGEVELTYDETGDGRPLVLVMGIGAQRIFWDERLCARLAARGHRVIRFDHRDIGESTRLDHLPVPRPWPTLGRRMAGLPVAAPYTLSDMARDVVGLCDHLGVARAHVVGCSMGGMVAQHLAIEHPDRVASLTSIMSSPGGRRHMLGGKPAALRALLSPAPRTADEAAEHAVRVFRTIGGSRYEVDGEALRALGRQAFARGGSPRGFLRHLAAICASGNRTRSLAGVRVPTLVVHGEEDPLIPVAAGRATARAIPGARLHVVPGMGHHMPPGVWDELVDAIAATAARA
ncbi:MAG: alpha/beta fold hydrolase [Myxococcales bacterium]|nr:alpha/beta fold hydrolase [Myxococcales bacterium]